MNRRLQQFLELEQLKPAQFADIMGIQRSNVSHILSGRNKPGFDFIQKFLLKFPSVNPDWLLLGRGKPLREQNTSAPAPRQQDSSPDLFSPSIELDLDGGHSYAPVPETESTQDMIEDGDEPMSAPVRPQPRDVRRITLFYSDGTFQEFYPPK